MAQSPSSPLGEFIREQRKLARLSLREMARMTSVSNAYLSQIERGLHAPSVRVLHSVAEALGVPIEELFSRSTPDAGDPGPGRTSAAPGPVENAIRADPRLTPVQKEALLGVYRGFVDAAPED